jgi:molybdopterin/thiamine biosynthesis adenylyltransferase
MLTSRQIERYSRQIITPGFGGSAQERLLAAHVIATGKLDDLDPVLPYLIGAGVGRIDLDTDADSATIASLQERSKDLNSDVELAADQTSRRCDLLLVIARERTVAERIHDLTTAHSSAAIVYARLDATATIAVIPSRSPCLLCADIELNVPTDKSSGNAGLVAMIAGLEAIKLLAGIAPAEARLMEFDRYAATTRSLRQRSGSVSCGCPRVSSQ